MKKTYWTLGVVVLVAVVLYFWLGKNGGQFTGTPVGTASPSSSYAGFAPKKVYPPTSATKSTKTYTQFVKEYEGRRIQFDERCQVEQESVVFKNNTSVMLDNRSSVAKTITVGNAKYSLPAYGYQVITLYSSRLPQSLMLSCGNSVNVGKVLLEANIYNQ